MSQERLLQLVMSIMLTAGFDVSERCSIRPRSFDLIASRDRRIIVIKVVSHIDSVSEDLAVDLDRIARCLEGTPLIVGERARDAELERGGVYIRYGIYAVNPATLYDYFTDGVPPVVHASPGGLYVTINGERLRELRERRQLSLGDLASMLGVSRRTISKYESGMGTTLEGAIRLEEIFDDALAEPIDIMDYQPPTPPPHVDTDREMPDDLQRMGLEIHPLRRAPFQVLTIIGGQRILTAYGSSQKVVRRAPLLGSISEIAHTHAMCILTDYRKDRRIGKTLVIGEERLHGIEYGEDLLDMIIE